MAAAIKHLAKILVGAPIVLVGGINALVNGLEGLRLLFTTAGSSPLIRLPWPAVNAPAGSYVALVFAYVSLFIAALGGMLVMSGWNGLTGADD